MGMRTVRLDDDTEEILTYVRTQTGLSVSEALKQGLRSYADALKRETSEKPIDVFRRLDLGPGGYAIAPAKDAKVAAADLIRQKHLRDLG